MSRWRYDIYIYIYAHIYVLYTLYIHIYIYIYVKVSENGGTPKKTIHVSMGFSLDVPWINHGDLLPKWWWSRWAV